jgi:phage terminase large subunit
MQDYELIVEPNSTNIAKELNNYIYSDKKSGLVIDNFNHAIDAIRYNVFFNLSNPNKGSYFIY